MTRLIIVRHGESEGNAKNEFQGQYNSDLTDRGHLQAECTAGYLDSFNIDAIYSSDIRRAMSTAAHVAERRGMQVTPDAGLREIYAGVWERMKFDDIAAQYPDAYRAWRGDIGSCRCPGGESVAELCSRIKAALDRIASENKGKSVLVTTHATPIRAMRCVWLGLSLSQMQDIPWVPNASVTVTDYCDDGSCRVVMYGEAGHLIKAGLLTCLSKKI